MLSNPRPCPAVYVDGSCRDDRVFYGFVVVEGDKCIHRERGELEGAVTEMHQIGGELKAVIEAIKWAKSRQQPVTIYYDYSGIEYWVGDLFGKKPWKTSKIWTAKYRHWVLANRQWVAGMVKVKSHSGDFWNEQVDAFVAGGADGSLGAR